MSLKSRISKIEKKLPKEDRSLTELSYHGAEPTLEESEIALKYTGELDPPWKVMYVPYDFKQNLESLEITEHWVMTMDDKLGLYYDGEILYKLIENYDKEKEYFEDFNMIKMINYFDPDILL